MSLGPQSGSSSQIVGSLSEGELEWHARQALHLHPGYACNHLRGCASRCDRLSIAGGWLDRP
jgi:hypothetical protein